MVIFLDELKKILKEYNQPYTINDWVINMHPDNQGWSEPRHWVFKNGNLIDINTGLLYDKIYDIFDDCFKWSVIDGKFSQYDNYINQYDLQNLFLKKFSTINYFYNPRKMKIVNYKIIYLNQKKSKKIKAIKMKKLKI